MSDVLYDGSYDGSGVLPSGAFDGSSVEQLNGEVNSSGSFTSSVPGIKDATETLMSYESGSANGLETFNNNFVILTFVVIVLLSAIFGTLLFSLLKDFFK